MQNYLQNEYGHLDIWVVGTSRQLFIGGLKLKQQFHQKKVVTGKTASFVVGPFCTLQSIFVLTLTSGRALLYGNVTFSISVLSTEKRFSIFLEKVFVSKKLCFKVKVLKRSKFQMIFT